MKSHFCVFATLALSFFVSSCDLTSKPKDYDGCILKSLVGVTSDAATRAVKESCRNKFPVEKTKSRALIPMELEQLKGRGGFLRNSERNGFSIALYNGNSKLTIDEVTVRLTADFRGDAPNRLFEVDAHQYQSQGILPLSNGYLVFDAGSVGEKSQSSWDIVSAKGH